MSEQEGRTGLLWRVCTSGRGEVWGESIRGWIWYQYCVHMYENGKMKPVETIPGIGRGDKGE
jgi:hypothetical protein